MNVYDDCNDCDDVIFIFSKFVDEKLYVCRNYNNLMCWKCYNKVKQIARISVYKEMKTNYYFNS